MLLLSLCCQQCQPGHLPVVKDHQEQSARFPLLAWPQASYSTENSDSCPSPSVKITTFSAPYSSLWGFKLILFRPLQFSPSCCSSAKYHVSCALDFYNQCYISDFPGFQLHHHSCEGLGKWAFYCQGIWTLEKQKVNCMLGFLFSSPAFIFPFDAVARLTKARS